MMKAYIELYKLNLSIFIAMSCATGFLLRGEPGFRLLTVAAGVFFLACGCCAMNQYQERNIDARMERTRERPLPSGRMSPRNALLSSLCALSAGLLLLVLTESIRAVVTGAAAVLLYNGIYTYLKRKTAFASVPCAAIGAMPPLIGWFAGGGKFPDQHIAAVCSLFYIWQITHFWLLFLSHGSDYEKAGLPSLTRVFTVTQLERIVFIWLFATAVYTLAMSLYGLFTSRTIDLLLTVAAMWLVWTGAKLAARKSSVQAYQSVFNRTNVYILLVMALLNIESVVR